jgi:hypothetical protein
VVAVLLLLLVLVVAAGAVAKHGPQRGHSGGF